MRTNFLYIYFRVFTRPSQFSEILNRHLDITSDKPTNRSFVNVRHQWNLVDSTEVSRFFYGSQQFHLNFVIHIHPHIDRSKFVILLTPYPERQTGTPTTTRISTTLSPPTDQFRFHSAYSASPLECQPEERLPVSAIGLESSDKVR